MIGSTISHYKILEKLGEGGMGVVYKAQDTKLDRLVALKFLPQRIAVGEEDKARFLQEAKAASAVMHPNVCVIYDIQEHQGQQFIVMEYVDGKTLRHTVPVQKTQTAIEYAIQIGEALQEAHSKGIVHRDIKTDNIMVNTKNQIKVMDFGLAKLKGSLKLTKTSSTVGTLAYMAPEQIQGEPVDARSDIFSFGVVLYEMLTGHMPFRGEHEAAMMYSILNEEPESLQKHLMDAPSELVHVLNRALEKDPDERYQNVAEMVIDLKRLKKQTSRVSRMAEPMGPSEGPMKGTAAPSKHSTRGKKGLALLVMSALVIVCVAVLIFLTSRSAQLNPNMTTRVLQTPFRDINYCGMTPDGSWMVFPAQDDQGRFDVYMMNISQGQLRRITNDSSLRIASSSISPDQGTVVYSRLNLQRRTLETVSVSSSGGQGRVVVDTGWMATFSRDGKRIYYHAMKVISPAQLVYEYWTCALDGSGRRCLMADTMLTRPILRWWFCLSPDEKSVSWTKNFPEGYTEIMIRNLETGMDRQLTFDKKFADDPLWTPSDHVIYASNKGGNFNLWVIPATGGESIQLTRGSGPDFPAATTADGKKLLYGELQAVGHIKLANLRDGSVRQLTIDDRARGLPAISPTGRYIVFPAKDVDVQNGLIVLYVMDRDGGNVRKLTSDSSYKISPAWSPDEKWITYGARFLNEPEDSTRLYLVRHDQPHQPRLVGKCMALLGLSLGEGSVTSWINEKQLVVYDGVTTYVASVDHDGLEKFSEDSIFARPILDGHYVVSFDWHKGHEGWSITSASSYKALGTAEAKLLCRGAYYGTFAQGGKEFFYWNPMTRELHRIHLPDGKDERIKGTFPGMSFFFDVRGDGQEIVYQDWFNKRRFVLIENVFK